MEAESRGLSPWWQKEMKMFEREARASYSVWDEYFDFPEVLEVIDIGDTRVRLFLAEHARVRLIDPPDSDLRGKEGTWGELRRKLPWPRTHTLPDHFSVEVLSSGDCWMCDLASIESVASKLRDKISRRNRQIDDLRRELSEAKRDKEYWEAVAKDYERTVSRS